MIYCIFTRNPVRAKEKVPNFLAHLSTKCSVSFCDPSMSGVRRPSSVRPSVRPSTISLNNISSETAYWILTKLHRNDPLVVPYQSCSNCSSWLHKQVTGSKNRFSKCNFQKSSCPKLQGPELSYLAYSIIQRSSTKVVQIMPLGSKLTPPRGSHF